ELVAIGGIQPLMKMLLSAGLLHPECLTVTGHTLRENLEKVPMYMSGQEIVRPLSDPLKKDSHLVVLRSEEHTSELQSLRHLVCRDVRSFPTRRSSDLSWWRSAAFNRS